MKAILIFILFFSLVWAKEPSAFELQNGNTKKEIQSIKNKSEQQSNKIFELDNRVKQLETSLEGLKSIYEGYALNIKEINDKINTNDNTNIQKNDIQNLQEQVLNNTNNIQLLKNSLDSINNAINQIQEILSAEIEKQNDNATKPINTNRINDNNTTNPKVSTESIKDSSNIDFDKDTTRRGDIFKEARSLTYAKKFNEAIARYKWFIEIDYKKAESNYMLGNIAYEQNRYNDAIYYYKESAILDDKATYMPRLLLNSANSFRVLKDIDNAKNFYNSLLSLFPNSNEAKEAKSQLDKLK
ncbi:hypothetical protein CCY99_05235 [Helicobacter sp. 16-1353]|uniref:tetratricopeptide repeat protein n=1 Tax=Helicobacter sp. 16-1353 TaxID=2004996 RepID=UPI000DCC5F52|nr:tetratricopeptide repeat protein [Helicobacter sp. 16-1353]RAX54084.1 hypothetical protein CCY99_05235 [Helicobacter sp. 16-1353]